MTLLDLILIALLASFVFSGFRLGFIHALGSLIGVALGAYIATHYTTQIALWVASHSGVDIRAFGKWVTFFLIFFIVGRLVGIIFWFVERSVGLLVHLPFLHSINATLGGIVSFFEGALIIGLTISYAKYLPVPQVSALFAASKLAPWFIKMANILLPLVPEALRKVMTGTL